MGIGEPTFPSRASQTNLLERVLSLADLILFIIFTMDLKKNNNSEKAEKQIKEAKQELETLDSSKSMGKKALVGMNPYAATLLDPFSVRGVRVPDNVEYPSVPFSLTQRSTLAVNSNAFAMITFGVFGNNGTPNLNARLVPTPSNTANSSYTLGSTSGGGASVNDVFGGVMGANGPNPLRWAQWSALASPVPNLYNKVRLVSFGATVQYIGSLLNSQGKITLVAVPRNFFANRLASAPLTLDQLLAAPGAMVVSVPLKGAGTVLYKPQDNISLEYTSLAFNQDALSNNENGLGAELYICIDGAVANQSFLVTFTGNYEGIPATGTFMSSMLDATPSKADPIALSHALNIAASTPSCLPSQPTAISTTASVSSTSGHEVHAPHEDQDKSMFEKLFDGLELGLDKGAKLAKKVSPLASTLLALL